MSELYDTDVLLWSEQQAALLRRVAKDARVDDEIDWENVIDEVESVGRGQLRAVLSLLMQNAHSHAQGAGVADESRRAALAGGGAAVSRRSNRQLHVLYAATHRSRQDYRALLALPDTVDGQPPLPLLAATCPLTLDELLRDG